MSDESLDNLFKKGLSEENVPFNMESWRKMEQMLPAEKKPAGFVLGTSTVMVASVLFLATSAMLWSFYTANSNTQNVVQSNQTETTIQKSATSTLTENQEVFSDRLTSSSQEELIIANTTNKKLDLSTPIDRNVEVNGASNQVVKAFEEPNKLANKENVDKLNESKNYSTSNVQNEFFAQNTGFEEMRLSVEESEALRMEPVYLASVEMLESEEGIYIEEDDQTLFAEIGDAKLPRVSKNQLGIIGGLSFNASLVNSGQASMGSSELFGLSYQRFLKGGFSVHADLLYAPRNGVNATTTHTSQIFDFGKVDVNTTVSCQRLVYLELPIMMSYTTGNHSLLGGASLAYLLDAQAKVSDEYMYPSEAVVEDRMEWGHNEGFNPLDFSLLAGYEYTIRPQWNVGMRFNYGLLDVTKNDYFDNDSFHNNMQFRVYLKFSPVRF